MTYLRAFGDLFLRMSDKHNKKGKSYLNMELRDLWGQVELDKPKIPGKCDGLLGEMQELHKEIIGHMNTGQPMTGEEIERAINEANDVAIYALLISDWLRNKRAKWTQ